jgi:hypothetical protein
MFVFDLARFAINNHELGIITVLMRVLGNV